MDERDESIDLDDVMDNFSTVQYFEVNPKSYVIGQFNEMFSELNSEIR